MQQVIDNINKHLSKQSTLAIAVSGGVDSMCLLHMVHSSQLFATHKISALHVDHMIRGAESTHDREAVAAYCKRHNIPLIVAAIDIPSIAYASKQGYEECARIERYKFFAKLVASKKVDFVATAHNLDDNAESVLMHIFRGCGLKGLGGMSQLAYGYLIRPMLEVSREEINAYLSEHNVAYCTDSTNADSTYTRNFIRNELTPLISMRYPRWQDSVCRLSRYARQDDGFINSQLELNSLIASENAVKVPLSKLVQYSLAVRYIGYALQCLDVSSNIHSTDIDRIINLTRLANGKCFVVGAITITKEYEYLAFSRKVDKVPTHSVKFGLGDIAFLNKTIRASLSDNSISPTVLKVDYDCIGEQAVLRQRQEGDTFCPYGGKTKPLKKYLIDKKIPARLRDSLVLLADGHTVLAILGVEISSKCCLTPRTTQAIQLEVIG